MNLKEILKQSPLAGLLRKTRDRASSLRWFFGGRIGPAPHFIKQATVLSYARKYNCDCLVETGTFLGDMVEAMLPYFKNIYSIELDPSLYRRAKVRFAKKDQVKLLQGDSGILLASVIPRIPKNTIFWLDGHYSGGVTAKAFIETPIMQELHSLEISQGRYFVILIDDARMFVGRDGYPTIAELWDYVAQVGTHAIEVRDDIIRLTPRT
jgi:hypothetical protein